jgi:penicillin-insensitive murein DD-endopeptidase
VRSLALWALLSLGCVGAPSPLAPSLSGSVGTPQSGVQTEPEELPTRGPGFARYRPNSPNYWGSPRLIRALVGAAARVSEAMPGGAPLLIGDISSRHGGKIPGHRSHRTGRDVDLLYYVTTPTGAPIVSRGFVSIDSDGLGRVPESDDYVRLDIERQWLLVKELMLSPELGVQWMFASRAIEALLIDYAMARGEDPELVWQAETVLLQPADSTPHADHIHLRIACAPEETVLGCEGGGPYWPWLPRLPSLAPLDSSALGEIARDDPFDLEMVAERGPPHGDGA